MSEALTERVVGRASDWFARRPSRRNVLRRAAIVGSALAVSPLEFILRPTTAYASLCGPASSCSSGWAAMCCTVNRGVNQCPPGSFPGGWWKADNAGLCGNGPRYIIDCQAECRCSCSYSNFCSESCWDCHPHCASGTCDERRVCWNVFRYGQCHQDIGCTGPVMCRMVSCVPPWEYDHSCTRDAATDDRTVDHNAPCLPQAWTPLQVRYNQIGGPASVLGPSTGAEYPVTYGVGQNFVRGHMYWSQSTGAHWVRYAILTHYLAVGGSRTLGLPTSDEQRCPDGQGHFNNFLHGAVYWTAPFGAHAVRQPFYTKWKSVGLQISVLGYPTADQATTPDGKAQVVMFQGGPIYWTAAGVHELHGPIWTFFKSFGAGVLGYPTTDVFTIGAGSAARFDNGSIDSWSAGTFEVHGPINAAWQGAGGETGSLGFPTTNVTQNPDGTEQSVFQGGMITYNPATGQTQITYTGAGPSPSPSASPSASPSP